MLNTKQDAAKNSASSEFLENHWLSVHWACKYLTLIFLPLAGRAAHIVKYECILCFYIITLSTSKFKISGKYAKY